MRIVLASRNPKKVSELQGLLPDTVEVVPVSAFPEAPEVEETGDTFAENATLKAEAVRDATGLPALADDSGLVVDALDGAPGVYSARFAGDSATDADNNALLLEKLQGVTGKQRSAHFVCVIAWAVPGNETQLFYGKTHGQILEAAVGHHGFGYDPLFLSDDLGRSFATASAAEKGQISHRGRALKQFVEALTVI